MAEIKIADKPTLDEVNKNQGKPSDPAAATGETQFGVLNYLALRFTSYWTNSRAALLDRLDATVSSRSTQTSVDAKASQDSVDKANTILGTVADAARTAVSSTAGTVIEYIKGIITLIGATNASAGTSSIFARLAQISSYSAVSGGIRESVHTSDGTFTVPAGVTSILVTACGAGGGGGGSQSSYGGAGGGGGGAQAVYKQRYSVTSGSNINITVGAGGTGGTSGSTPAAGSDGGTTSVGSLVSLGGGKGGTQGYRYTGGSGATYAGSGGAAGGTGGGTGGGGALTGPSNFNAGGGGGGSLGGGGAGGVGLNRISGDSASFRQTPSSGKKGIIGQGGSPGGGSTGGGSTTEYSAHPGIGGSSPYGGGESSLAESGGAGGPGAGGGGATSHGLGTGGAGGPGLVIIEW